MHKIFIILLLLPSICFAEYNPQSLFSRNPVETIHITRDIKIEEDETKYTIHDIELNQEGEMIGSDQLYPFGKESRHTGEIKRKIGNERDEETGFDSFDARYYDSDTGRWNSTDPLNEDSTPYSYTLNNPVNRFDPTGMISKWNQDAMYLSMPEKNQWEPPEEQSLQDGGIGSLLEEMVIDPLIELYTEATYRAYQTSNDVLKGSMTLMTGVFVFGMAANNLREGKVSKWKRNKDLVIFDDPDLLSVSPKEIELLDYFGEIAHVGHYSSAGKVLSFDIKTKVEKTDMFYDILMEYDNVIEKNGFLRYKGLPSGREFVQESYDRFEYDAIEGLWLPYSDNNKAFWKNMRAGMSKEDAALNTWTGSNVPKEYRNPVFQTIRQSKVKLLFTK